jgi:acyl-coenzyme A thioesterase PaaI-like protein
MFEDQHAPQEPTRSFLTALGLRLRPRDGEAHGTAELGPSVWAKGSERPRLGALATMADVVAGFRPTGPLQPTVDLAIRLLSPPPPTGEIHLACRPLEVGRRLFVGEVLIDHAGRPLARAVATFMNQPYTGPGGPPPGSPPDPSAAIPFDDWLRPRFVDERTVLVEKSAGITNGPGGTGTIQGGLQATLAELAAEWALAPQGDFVVVDLDIRYLGPVLAGPLRARADVLTADDDRAVVRVGLDDAGTDGRPVAHVTTVCQADLRWRSRAAATSGDTSAGAAATNNERAQHRSW